MRIRHYITGLLTILVTAHTSCQKMTEEEGAPTSQEEKVLKVKARTTDNNRIPYPLHVYAFGEDNRCVATQTLKEEEEQMEFKLPEGNYSIVAVSDPGNEYILPEPPTLQDKIKLTSSNGANRPLMTGRADISVNSHTHALSLALSYAVTSISVALKNVSTDVAGVTVAVASLYSAITLAGEYTGEVQKLMIPCSLDTENIWTANAVYAFPGKGEETVISITLKKKDLTEETFSYTYQGIPKANKPFNISGNYTGDVTVGGTIIANGWEEATDVIFDFGTHASNDENKEESDEGTTNEGSTDEQPEGALQTGDIWNNGIVVTTTYNNKNQALLMSLDEGKCLAGELYDYIDEYIPDGWRLPNETEAYLMNQTFQGDTLEALNKKLEAKGYPIIKTDKYRYFYDSQGDIYAFGFKSNSKFQPAGESTQYYLRTITIVDL